MFRSSNPVTSNGFYDRTEELAELRAAFAALAEGAPRWMAIIGPRKVGKTSLLLEASFARHSHDPAGFRALLHGSPDASRLDASLRIELDRLCDAPADPDAVRHWLQLPEELAIALDRHLVLAIDEVQELAALRSRVFEPFPVMRAVWQRHTRVAYILSGSAPSVLRELVTARHSPFFQHFRLLELGPFSREDAIWLLTDAAPDERPIPVPVAARIHELVGGHPFYLQLFGDALVATEPPYDIDSLKPVLQRLLFSRTGSLSLFFENEYRKLVGRATTIAATLEALAARPASRLTALATAIGASTASTARYLERLGDAVVRSEDATYRLADPLFGSWVRWRGPGGTVVPMTIVGNEAEIATAHELAALGFDLVYQSRASRGAFDLLALRGPDQLAVQVKRSLRFRKAEWARMEADADRYGWAWAIVAVDPGGDVRVLDPASARHGRQVRLAEDAIIDNVLRWLDRKRRAG